jgi:two-component system, NtrC family, phosphoglycerate transport system response regulator PgtA
MKSEQPVVLLVDDDPIVLAVNQERLEQMGYLVHARDQVLGTSQWIVQNSPWIVLLDVMMPAMSGGELALFLKKRGISTHVILHSSKDLAELRDLMRETGALGVIQKGLDDQEFENQFQNLAKLAQRKSTSPSLRGSLQAPADVAPSERTGRVV